MPIERRDAVYAACYCEENIYLLAQQLQAQLNEGSLHVIVIGNEQQRFPLWHNTARTSPENPDGLIVWDYHVILVHRKPSVGATEVYDFDSDVPWPCLLSDYARRVLREETTLLPAYRRLYRVIPVATYLRDFSSDRSHMLNAERTGYLMPVPPWPCIGEQGSKNSMPGLYEMRASMIGVADAGHLAGTVLDQVGMLEMMGCNGS